MNSAIVHAKLRSQAAKRPPLSDPSVLASLPIDARRQIVFSDDLRHRWERIVAGGRA